MPHSDLATRRFHESGFVEGKEGYVAYIKRDDYQAGPGDDLTNKLSSSATGNCR